MVKEILFATSNQGKARELKEAFKQADVDVIIKTNADLENPPHPIESGHTFEANAKIKAHELADFSKMPTIADDSGLMVDALNGEPGVRSARYAGEAHNDAKNNAKLLAELGGVPKEKRMAKFWTTIVVSMPGEFDKDLVVSGTCAGRILPLPQVMLRLNDEFREQHGVSHLVMAAFSVDRHPLVCVGFGDKVVFHRDKNIENNSLLNLYVVKK